MLENRVPGIKERVLSLELYGEHAQLLERTLDLLTSTYTALEQRSAHVDRDGQPSDASNELTAVLDDLPDALGPSDPTEALLGWAEIALTRMIRTVEYANENSAKPDDDLLGIIDYATHLRNRVAFAIDLLGYRGRAEETLASIEASQAKAQEATGEIGEATFARHFADHAKSERTYAEVLRWVTVVLIGGAVAYAVFTEHPKPGDWVGLISRGAVIAGVTAIAAYLARQAGQHRRAAEWAKSIEIQVRTFPAFVDGVPEEDRSFVLRQLAARMLASPPDKSGNGTEDSVSYGQVLDLVSTLAKKSS